MCLLRSIAFVPAPSARSPDATVVAGAAVLATTPLGADAFVFKGSWTWLDMAWGNMAMAMGHNMSQPTNERLGEERLTGSFDVIWRWIQLGPTLSKVDHPY